MPPVLSPLPRSPRRRTARASLATGGRVALALAVACAVASPALAADPRVAVASDAIAVVRTDGTVWAWGRGTEGQLGDGRLTNTSLPVRVAGLTGIVDVVAGDRHFLALKADGTVWAWGTAGAGLLGSTLPADRTTAPTPVQVPELSDIRSLAAGRGQPAAWAVDGTGRTFHWGSNGAGQAGVATVTATAKPVPAPVVALSGTGGVAAGDDTFLAFFVNGQVGGWGTNPRAALGVPFLTPPGEPPLAVTPLGATGLVRALAVTTAEDNTHAAVRRDGTVALWGVNSEAQAGCGQSGATAPVITAPRMLAGFGDAVAVAAGHAHVLILQATGAVFGCGANADGQLGDNTLAGTGPGKAGPVRASLSQTMHAIAAAGRLSASVSREGSVWVWGTAESGAAGDGGATQGTASQRVITAPLPVLAEGGVGRLQVGVSAVAPALFTGTVTGPLERATVHLGVSPAAADVGQVGRLYVAALLPDGSLYLNAGAAGWVLYTSGVAPPFRTGPLARHEPVTLFRDADLRFARGAVLLVGYGVGPTDISASNDLLERRQFGAALALQ